MQEARRPEGSGPARLEIIRCRRAARPLRERQADLQTRPPHTTEDRTGLSPDLSLRTSIMQDQVSSHDETS